MYCYNLTKAVKRMSPTAFALQPLYTKKLGLSLAYDIVKAHSGEIKVETKEVKEVSL